MPSSVSVFLTSMPHTIFLQIFRELCLKWLSVKSSRMCHDRSRGERMTFIYKSDSVFQSGFVEWLYETEFVCSVTSGEPHGHGNVRFSEGRELCLTNITIHPLFSGMLGPLPRAHRGDERQVSSSGRERIGWLSSHSSPRCSLQVKTNYPSSEHEVKRCALSQSVNQSFGVWGFLLL